MNYLYIAEKPDLGRAIADAIDGTKIRGDGFIKVNSSTITWCFGHLLELKEPKEYNSSYEKWSLDILPFNINKLEYKPSKDKSKQIKIIKELVSQCDIIVHAGDPDDEGQFLVDLVLDYIGNKKPVKRVLINDNTTLAVKKALNNLKDNKDFVGLKNSAMFRNQADWKYGLNLTIGYTMASRKNAYNPNVLSVGRVQTPILNLVHNREVEVQNHVKELYYNLLSNNFFKFEIPKEKLEEKLCKDKDYIVEIQKDCFNNNDFIITSVEVKNVETTPLLPYNLLELQADAYKRFKYSPDKVKDITQKLRETYKAITYNRSDCQYLTLEHYEDRNELITSIKTNLPEYNNLTLDTSLKSKAFNNANVSAHHGIIPTINKVNVVNLSSDELNIYKIITERYLIQFMPNKVVERTSYTATNKTGHIFKASTNKVLCTGWTEFYKGSEAEEEKEEEHTNTYNYKKGDKANFTDFKVVESETKPKQLYTFATLLKDLTNVAKYIKDPNIRKKLQDKDKEKKGENGGIGTPATRDTILTKLIARNFMIEEKGKLTTTDLGKQFLASLPDSAKTPDMTALWAEKQFLLKENKITLQELLTDIDKFVEKEVTALKTGAVTIKPMPNNSNTSYAKKTYSKAKPAYKPKSGYKNGKTYSKSNK